jgi:hypothetical protein
MPALKGSLSYARYFIEGELPKDFRERYMRAIRLRSMKPLEVDDDATERSGWCALGEPFEIDLHYDSVFYNNYINLGFRTDRWVIPGPLLRTRVREAEAAYLAKKGREKLSKHERTEIKELVSRKLRKQFVPTTRAVDLSWSISEALFQPVAAHHRDDARVVRQDVRTETDPRSAVHTRRASGLERRARETLGTVGRHVVQRRAGELTCSRSIGSKSGASWAASFCSGCGSNRRRSTPP